MVGLGWVGVPNESEELHARPCWAPLGPWPINWIPTINANVCSMVKHYRKPLRVEQTSTNTTTAQGHTNNYSKQDVATEIGES